MNTSAATLDFDRINYLLNPAQFAETRVTIVGLGSGGAPACDHLTMNGIRLWELYDHDILDAVNLVKHPRMRRDLGRLKVEVQRDWIIDRNPSAEVNVYADDVLQSGNFERSIKESDLVLVCPDKKAVREFASDKCVEAGVPFVTASVFRTGIGGEIFGYIPGETACYRCLQLYAVANDLDLTDEQLGLTEDEQHRIYGLGDEGFRASGLSIDIQTIALIQARLALSILLRDSGSSMPTFKANWIVFGNRPAKGIFTKHFDVRQMLLRPQRLCSCVPDSLLED